MQTISTNINQAISDFKNIKDKIVECGVEIADGTPTSEYARKVSDVFEYGKSQGGDGDGYYDTFWDAFQQNGERYSYSFAFAQGWNDESFCPKYDMIVRSCNGMFQQSGITDLKGRLNELGITLDVSQSTTLLQMFQNAGVKHAPAIDGSNAASLSYTFGSNPRSAIETIEKLILSNKLTNVGNAFLNAEKLTHVIFEGELAITGLDIHWSTKLDAESYHSLMGILSKTTSGTSITLPAYATVKATYDAKYGEGAWDIMAASKTNWTIAYA